MKNSYEVRGEVTAIFLRRRDGSTLETLIDTEDLEKAKAFKNSWTTYYDPKLDGYYVQGSLTVNGKETKVSLHRYLTDAPPDKVVDHLDHDTLNNRRKSNLRAVTHSGNMQNRNRANTQSSTGIRGVYPIGSKYGAQISIQGKYHYLGTYETVEKAAEALKKFKQKGEPKPC